MVLRRDDDGVLAVGQASHAWLCGQFARAWGNERFGAVEPLDEVALGAEQHDVGMARWDLDPVRNPETGLPQSFMEMGAQVNAGLWARGPQRLVTQSRYAALLAIMHGRRLYENFAADGASTEDATAVRSFSAQAAELEGFLLEVLRADPLSAPHVSSERLARNSGLVWIWDTMSLALLLDWAPMTLTAVPTANGKTVDVAMEPVAPRRAGLNPWPFAEREVEVHCDGRRLTHGFDDDEAMAADLPRARWETVQFTLVPGAELRERL
jgi:hypothetical protein